MCVLLLSILTPVLPTNSQQTLLYGVPLGFGEAAAFGQAVNRVEQGVDQWGERLRPRKQWSTFGQERQHGGTQIPVEGERHVCGTESNLTQIQRQKKGGKIEKRLYLYSMWSGLVCCILMAVELKRSKVCLWLGKTTTALQYDNGKHNNPHTTKNIDFVIILSGEYPGKFSWHLSIRISGTSGT